MNIKDAKTAMLNYMECDIPTFLWGAPGIGKSDAVRQVAATLSNNKQTFKVIDFRAILRDPVDLRGLPTIDKENNTARWLSPNDLPNEKRDGAEGIFFMDELNAAPPSVQAACFGLVLDRKVGEYKMPPGWRIIAAGNRQSDQAAAQRMPSALANRFAHIDVDADVDAFAEWANKNNIAAEVIGFLRFRPDLLHDMTAAPNTTLRTFPTPRAWANVSKIVDKANSDPNTKKVEFHLIKGLIGEGAAVEFKGFQDIYSQLPSIAQILTTPTQAQVPDKPDARYAVSSGLSRKVDKKSFPNALTYMKRLPKEFEVMFVIDVMNSKPDVRHSEAFTSWAVENQGITLG